MIVGRDRGLRVVQSKPPSFDVSWLPLKVLWVEGRKGKATGNPRRSHTTIGYPTKAVETKRNLWKTKEHQKQQVKPAHLDQNTYIRKTPTPNSEIPSNIQRKETPTKLSTLRKPPQETKHRPKKTQKKSLKKTRRKTKANLQKS